MREVNWTALNRALCDEMGLNSRDLISVDALMPLLAARNFWPSIHRTQLGFRGIVEWVQLADINLRDGQSDTPGHALALAACAALGVEVPYAE